MNIDRTTRRDVIDLLMPHLPPQHRQTLVRGAFWGDSILGRITWEGDNATFTANLVNTLLMDGPLDDGADALPALLEEVRLHVPPNDRAAVDALLQRVANPTAPQDRFDRATARLATRDYLGAIAIYREAIAAQDRPAEAHYQLGRVLEVQQDYEGALAHYEMSLRLQPNARVHTRRGVIYALRDDREAALAAFEQATTDPQPDARGYFYRAMLHFDEGQYDAALSDLVRALELDPTHARAHRERGVIHTIQKAYPAAEAALSAAISHDPSDGQAYYYRANVRDALGQTAEAIDDYTQAIRTSPNTAEFYYRRGKARFSLGDYAAVITDMEAALLRDDTNADAHFTLALCEMQHNRAYAVAKSHLTRALALDPHNPAIQNGLRIAQENLA